MSLRLKIFLASLLSALIVAGGSTWLFSNAWVELAQSYGLLSIQERLTNLSDDSTFDQEGEWALTMLFESRPEARQARWIRMPLGASSPGQLQQFEETLYRNIGKTNLKAGSFEIKISRNEEELPYFVVFQSGTKLGEENKLSIAGTRAQLGLQELSPLAAPFIGFLVIALAIAGLIAFTISHYLNKSYTLFERALEDIGAGRLSKLKLPSSKDVSVQRISRALQSMVNTLQQKEEQIEKVSALAHEDPMTKIPNFRAFSNYIDQVMLDRGSAGANRILLVIIDLDFFKKVNDNHGHQVGDFVLIEAAKIIKANIRLPAPGAVITDRRPDFCARYGGEEFVAIFNDLDSDKKHIPVLRILHAIKAAELKVPKDITSDGKSFIMKISASMGISMWDPKKFKDKDSWIKEADEALYLAKEGGRGRICAISPQKEQWL